MNTIARTITTPPPFIQVIIDQANPRWYVIEQTSQTVVGMNVYKVGQKTGTTSGTIQRTCVHLKQLQQVAPLQISWCQDIGSYGSSSGDSGAPVFQPISWQASTARLVGIHWGHYPWYVNPSGSAFSPLANVYIAYPELVVLPE